MREPILKFKTINIHVSLLHPMHLIYILSKLLIKMSLPSLKAKKTVNPYPIIRVYPSTSKASIHLPFIGNSALEKPNERYKSTSHNDSHGSDSISLIDDDSIISKASLDDSNTEISMKKFANKYKKQMRLNDRECNSKIKKNNGALAYINSASQLSLLPRAAGLVRIKGDNEINLK